MSLKSLPFVLLTTTLSVTPLEKPTQFQSLLSNLLTPQSSTSRCHKPCSADNALYSLIRRFEGFSPYTYLDSAGKPTIAFGHLIKRGEVFEEPITSQQAQTLLENDLKAAVGGVNKAVKVQMRQNQFDGLSSFAFNVGTGTLQKSTLLKKVNAGKDVEVPPQFLRYSYAGGKRLNGLVVRRQAEANLYAGK